MYLALHFRELDQRHIHLAFDLSQNYIAIACYAMDRRLPPCRLARAIPGPSGPRLQTPPQIAPLPPVATDRCDYAWPQIFLYCSRHTCRPPPPPANWVNQMSSLLKRPTILIDQLI